MPKNPLVRIFSFSYAKGEFIQDPTGNGGGFVFDCRSLPNPGRIPQMRSLTGRDPEVISMLENTAEVDVFLEGVENLVINAAKNYQQRNFSDLSVAFGCTGGRHRSVYCAERLAAELSEDGYEVFLSHRQMEREDPRFAKRRAFVLAAGYGTRLKPLTDSIPKALVPASGKQMLDWTMEALEKAEFNEIVVNAHHHAEQVIDWAKNSNKNDHNIVISEEAEILGTGGGIKQAGRYLYGPHPVLIHNVDIWTDFDLNALYEAHNPDDLVTLITQERESSSHLLVDEEKRVVGIEIRGEEKLFTEPIGEVWALGFSGIHVASPRLFEKLAHMDDFGIIDAYMKLIRDGETIRAKTVEGHWFDMGSPEKLERLERYLNRQ